MYNSWYIYRQWTSRLIASILVCALMLVGMLGSSIGYQNLAGLNRVAKYSYLGTFGRLFSSGGLLKEGDKVPIVTWRARKAEVDGVSCPLGAKGTIWEEIRSTDIFNNKRVILFSLPGAFTPTCSDKMVPEYEERYSEFQKHNIDQIHCISVNDPFVMIAWKRSLGVKRVNMIPDGNGDWTRSVGRLVAFNALGFGNRAWRHAMVVNNGIIEKTFDEPGLGNPITGDPYEVSSPDNVLRYLNTAQQQVS